MPVLAVLSAATPGSSEAASDEASASAEVDSDGPARPNDTDAHTGNENDEKNDRLPAELPPLDAELLDALETDVRIEADESPERLEFNRIRKEQGLKAALAWRDGHH